MLNCIFLPLLGFAFLTFVFVLVRTSFTVVTVTGTSMQPTLKLGEKVLVFRWLPLRWLKIGHIVVSDLTRVDSILQPKSDKVVKRIVGLPGDLIEIRVNAHVPPMKEYPEQDAIEIPPNHYFVQSDSLGADSHYWGPLPFLCFYGIVVLRLSQPDASFEDVLTFPLEKPDPYFSQASRPSDSTKKL